MRAQLCLSACIISSFAMASDHNNLDDSRPLRFEDAFALALRSQEVQVGFQYDPFTRSYRPRLEYNRGFALNRHIEVGFDPELQARQRAKGSFELSYFEAVQQETLKSPALAYRVDARSEGGARLRGIATWSVANLSKIHANLDGVWTKGRAFEWEATIGYSRPVGFDRTYVAQLSIADARRAVMGFGVRVQVGHQEVFDLGFEVDLNRRFQGRLNLGFTWGF